MPGMAMGLLSDAWFYVAASGFLASACFFVIFLNQYRAASGPLEDGEETELPAEDADDSKVEPIKIPEPAADFKAEPREEPAVASIPVEEGTLNLDIRRRFEDLESAIAELKNSARRQENLQSEMLKTLKEITNRAGESERSFAPVALASQPSQESEEREEAAAASVEAPHKGPIWPV